MASEGGNPAELPAELEGGGSGVFHFPGRGPNPAELPIFSSISVTELANELFRVIDRVHVLETAQLALRLRRPGVGNPAELPVFSTRARFLPNELPEGGEGGGGGRVPRPGGEIAELPVFDGTRVLREISVLRGLVEQLAVQVKELTEQVAARG